MTKSQIVKQITKAGNYKVSFTKANGRKRVLKFDADSVEVNTTNAVVVDKTKGAFRSFRYDAVEAIEKI